MIRIRRLYLGLLLGSVGWQSLYGMLSPPSLLSGLLLVLGTAVVFSAMSFSKKSAIWATLGVLLVQAMIAPGLVSLLARWKELPGLTWILSLIARSLGLNATMSEGRILFYAGDRMVDYLPNLSRLGAFPILIILCGAFAVPVFLPINHHRRAFFRLSLGLVVYAFLRMFLIMLARIELPENGLETSLWWGLCTLIPAAFFLGPDWSLSQPGETGFAARTIILSGLVGLCWTLALGWVDPGQSKRGRILFDEIHGDWEPTDTPFNTKLFHQRLSYAYSSLHDLLSWHYTVSRCTDRPFTDDVLSKTDVLIVKTPTEPFSSQEIKAIEHFVKGGGGLFLIGDHTNLFGMTTYLNSLASRFGVTFRDDDTFTLTTEAQSYWKSPLWLPHPIARLTREFEFETSCTIDVPLNSSAPIIGYGLGTEVGDYSKPGFFGNLHLDLKDDFGFFVQHAVINYGRGRVAAFSDSTTFSNFSLFFPGRRELVLATIEFLNRQSTPMRHVPFMAMIGFFISAALLSSLTRTVSPLGVASGLFAGLVLGTLIVTVTARFLSLPDMKIKVPRIVFDRSISRLILPSCLTTVEQWRHDGMDTFLVSAQRLGYMPVVSDDLISDFKYADTIVITHPMKKPTEKELNGLIKFVTNGGRLLLLDGLLHPGIFTNLIIRPFGLAVRIETVRVPVDLTRPVERAQDSLSGSQAPMEEKAKTQGEDMTYGNNVPEFSFSRPIITVTGGQSILRDAEGRSIYSEAPFGRGRVGVLVDSVGVSKGALGIRFVGEPSSHQLASHHTAFMVIKRIVEGKPWIPQMSTFGEKAERSATGKTKLHASDAEMVLIPAGEFFMGTSMVEIPVIFGEAKRLNPDAELGWFEAETPRHSVYIDDFYIDRYEVTNAQYRQFVHATGHAEPKGIAFVDGELKSGFRPWNDSRFNGDNQPVVCVSWHDAMSYARWVGKRLPTEAEWEKAARGGLVGTLFPWGNTVDHNDANYLGMDGLDRWEGEPAPVGSFSPNGFGLFDMAGNVWEWCLDEYQMDFYARSPRKNPFAGDSLRDVLNDFTGVETERVLRGGSWYHAARKLRVAYRSAKSPELAYHAIGFRCVKDSHD